MALVLAGSIVLLGLAGLVAHYNSNNVKYNRQSKILIKRFFRKILNKHLTLDELSRAHGIPYANIENAYDSYIKANKKEILEEALRLSDGNIEYANILLNLVDNRIQFTAKTHG